MRVCGPRVGLTDSIHQVFSLSARRRPETECAIDMHPCARVDRTCHHAITFAEGLRARGFDILNDVVLNQVLVSFGDDETTARVISAVQAEGTCWCGGTVWRGRKAMRISVSSWATTDSDVERSLDAILTLAAAESNSTA